MNQMSQNLYDKGSVISRIAFPERGRKANCLMGFYRKIDGPTS